MLPQGVMALFGDSTFTVISVMFFAIALTTWVWMLKAWTTPRIYRATGPSTFWRCHEPCFTFSLLVPARFEESVLGQTLDRLARVDHPWV